MSGVVVNYRTPLGQVRSGVIVGRHGDTYYILDSETDERVSVPASRLGDGR